MRAHTRPQATAEAPAPDLLSLDDKLRQSDDRDEWQAAMRSVALLAAAACGPCMVVGGQACAPLTTHFLGGSRLLKAAVR